jgi:hypothetical protein
VKTGDGIVDDEKSGFGPAFERVDEHDAAPQRSR